MEIVRPLRERYGFETRGMRVLGILLTPFFGCRCDVPDEIARLEEPVVFVCNHYEVFGPLAVVLSLPFHYRLWMNSLVAHAAQHIDYMIEGTRHVFPFLSERAVRRLLEKVAPLIERVLGRFRSIPVYHTHLGKQMKSIQHTVDAMLQNDSIVIFPENPTPAYSHGSVSEFFRSFALIGEYYRRQTGKGALFCPVYVDKKHRRLRFGQLVRYGSEPASAECSRIVEDLRGQLLCMAQEALGTQKEA